MPRVECHAAGRKAVAVVPAFLRAWGIEAISKLLPGSLRLAAQDVALSRRKQGFESPRERQINQILTWCVGRLTAVVPKFCLIGGAQFPPIPCHSIGQPHLCPQVKSSGAVPTTSGGRLDVAFPARCARPPQASTVSSALCLPYDLRGDPPITLAIGVVRVARTSGGPMR